MPVLQNLIKVAKDERVQRSTAWALVTLDSKNAENVKLAMPHLLKATSSDIPLVRKEAMTAFTTLGPAAIAALPSLLEHAASDADASVRMQSLHGLAEIQAPASQALPVAIASLDDPDAKVRNAARYLLGMLGAEAHSAAPLLRETLRRGEELDKMPLGMGSGACGTLEGEFSGGNSAVADSAAAPGSKISCRIRRHSWHNRSRIKRSPCGPRGCSE